MPIISRCWIGVYGYQFHLSLRAILLGFSFLKAEPFKHPDYSNDKVSKSIGDFYPSYASLHFFSYFVAAAYDHPLTYFG